MYRKVVLSLDVVMMYKVTIFERYTQHKIVELVAETLVMMYKVTIFERYTQRLKVDSNIFKKSNIEFAYFNFYSYLCSTILKDIHNKDYSVV